MTYLTLLLALLAPGLHWDARCFCSIPDEPPIAVDFMLVPNTTWLAQIDSAQVPDTIVDSTLTTLLQSSAKQNDAICGKVHRHLDPQHIRQAQKWPVKHYEPTIGTFYWQIAGPTPLSRKTG